MFLREVTTRERERERESEREAEVVLRHFKDHFMHLCFGYDSAHSFCISYMPFGFGERRVGIKLRHFLIMPFF